MQKHRNKLLSTLALAVLAACGGGGGGDTGTAPATSSGTEATAQSVSTSASPSRTTTAPDFSKTLHLGDLWLQNASAGQVQGYASLARLAGGGYVGVRASTGSGLVFQRLDMQGQAVGKATPVSASGASPSVAALANGDFIVTWNSMGGSSLAKGPMMAQRYSATGAPLGGAVDLGIYTDGSGIDAVSLADGGLLSTWVAQLSHVNGPSGYFQAFEGTGAARAAAVPLHQDASGMGSPVAATALPSGGFALAWVYRNLQVTEIVMRVYDAAAQLQDETRTSVPGLTVPPSLATLSDGNAVMVWGTVEPQSGARHLFARILDLTGTRQGAIGPFELANVDGRDPLPVASLGDGGFVIAWRAAAATETQVPVQKYSNEARPL